MYAFKIEIPWRACAQGCIYKMNRKAVYSRLIQTSTCSCCQMSVWHALQKTELACVWQALASVWWTC